MGKLEKLSEICRAFYETHSDFNAWEKPFVKMSSLLGAQACGLYLLRDEIPLIGVVGDREGALKECSKEFAERFINHEPRTIYLKRAQEGSIATDLEFTTRNFMRTSDFYDSSGSVPLKSDRPLNSLTGFIATITSV